MEKKLFLAAIALLLLGCQAQAQFYILDNHAIEIDVDASGNAQVSERFFITFQNEEQLVEFRQMVSEIGVSVEGWRSYDARIFPHIGQQSDIEVNGISFIEKPRHYLEINYSLKTPLMQKTNETSRVIEFAVKPKFFSQFVEGSLWVIPQGISIAVNLPLDAEIEPPVKPDAEVEGSSVTWNGYVFGNELQLNYRRFKQIASFDLREALQQLMGSDMFWILVAAVALASIGLIVKRKAIAGRIENYVVDHSDLGGEEEEE